MNRTRRLAALAVALLLAGCGVTTTSNRLSPSTLSIKTIQVSFDETPTVDFRVIRSGDPNSFLDKPKISPADMNLAVESARTLNRFLADGFRNDFPRIASSYGVQVDNSARTMPKLKAMLKISETRCGPRGCGSYFFLAGDLVDSSGQSLWSFKSELGGDGGSYMNADKFDAARFENFAKSLMEAMKRDNIIAR